MMIKEIKFTDNALKQINAMLSKKDKGSFFRIAIKGGGCSGFQYEFTFDKEKAAAKNRIAFYGSTPAYKNVLGVHGWGEMQIELNGMSKEGKWQEMGELITDEMLNTFGVMDEPGNVVGAIKERFGDIVDRTSGGFSFVDSDQRQEMVAALRA